MVSRRTLLKLVLAGALPLPLSVKVTELWAAELNDQAPPNAPSESEHSPPPARPRAPNLLLIALDDLNDWIGCLGGHPQAHTPHMDRLAQRGTLFTHAYCPAPLCNPSRTSLLTGLHPTTTGVFRNTQHFRQAAPLAVTLPQHFMANGYHVMGAGKIFHYADPDSWHDYFPAFDRPFCIGPLPAGRPLNGVSEVEMDWGPLDVPEAQACDSWITHWACDQLARDAAQPFFLAVGIVRPHLPWYVPADYFDLYPPAEITLPVVKADDLRDVSAYIQQLLSPEDWLDEHGLRRQAVAAYLTSVSFTDAQVGRLLDALDAGPHAEDTIVVLFGDNGFHLGTKRHWGKLTLWEESTHVPLILATPQATAARCGRAVSLIDLYPTLIDLCALSPHDDLEGRSLLPLLSDPHAPWDYPAITSMNARSHAIRTEFWRYIRYADGSEELYDHTVDPHEWTNLAGAPAYAEVKAALARFLPGCAVLDNTTICPVTFAPLVLG